MTKVLRDHPRRRRALALTGVALLTLAAAGLSAAALLQDRWAPDPAPQRTVAPPPAEPPAEAPPEATATPPAPETPAAPSGTVAAPQRLLLAGSDGALLRATVGSCPDPAGVVEASADGGRRFEPGRTATVGATRVLSASSTADGVMRLVTLDGNCEPQVIRSFVGGTSWELAAGDLPVSWYLDPARPTVARTPVGESPLPCEAVALVGSGTVGAALCGDAGVTVSSDQGRSWSAPLAVPGAAAIGLSRDAVVIASAQEPACAGVRTRLLQGGQLGDPGGCVPADAGNGALAVTGTGSGAGPGGALYLWAGDRLASSSDAGVTWE